MPIIEKIDTLAKKQVQRFINLPFRLYAGHEQWVQPIRSDIALLLNREKHPFYERSTADFFIAARDGRDVGRIAAIVNRNNLRVITFNNKRELRQWADKIGRAYN